MKQVKSGVPISLAIAALLLPACSQAAAQKISLTPGTISTVAGTGTAGDAGNSGAATSATITSPFSVRFDGSGNLYIAESSSYVREVVGGAGGTIKVFAGTGTGGFTGDGGPATSAEINTPRGLWVDGNNNVYISDSSNNRIRVVYEGGTATACLIVIENPTLFGLSTGATTCTGATSQPVAGDIYTIAGNGTTTVGTSGNLAVSQGLNSPRGVYVDTSGDVYIADITNNIVRMVYAGGAAASTLITLENSTVTTPAVGDMYTVAGGGTTSTDGSLATATKLNEPIDMNFDASGNLYIVEYGGAKVRQVSVTTGKALTIAGTGTAGFSGDGSAATAAQFSSPRGIWIDAGGGIYIADTANNRVRKFTVGGSIATIAGTGTAAYNGDAVNATAANFSAPYEVALDSAGNLYIADSGNNRIREDGIFAASFAFGNVAAGTTGSGQIATISNLGASTLTLSGINISTQYTQIASGGTDCTASSSIAPGSSCLLDIACSPSSVSTTNPGTAAVTSNGSSNGGNVSITLSCAGVVGSTTTMLTDNPNVNTAPSGTSITFNAAVTSTAGTPYGSVQIVNNGTTVLATPTLSTSGTASYTTTTLPPGNDCITAKYVATAGFTTSTSTPALCINIVNNAATTTTTVSATPTSAAYGSPVSLSATVSTTGANPPTQTVTFYDNGVALPQTGTLAPVNGVQTASISVSTLPIGSDAITASYGGDANNLGSVSATAATVTIYQQQAMLIPGVINTVIGTGTAGDGGNGGAATSATVSSPYVARSDNAGNLYVSDGGSYVREVNATTGYINIIAGTGTASFTGDGGPATSATISAARGLSIDGAGDVFISDTGNNRIRAIYNGGPLAAALIKANNAGVTTPVFGDIYTIAGGGAGTSGLGTQQSLNSPRGVLVDSFGNVFIADIVNNKVRVVYSGGASIAALITLENPTVLTPVVGDMYTVAGSGSSIYSGDGGLGTAAGVNEPSDMGFDPAGNLYIVEYGGDRVRKVSASTGLISTIAGNGTPGYAGDGSPANTTTTEFSSPRGLWVDGGGNVYIADSTNNAIRKIDAAGNLTTIAGGTAGTAVPGDAGSALAAKVNAPYSVALDPVGDLLLATDGDNRVRSVSPASSILNFPNTTVGSSSAAQTLTFANIGGVAVTPSAISASTGYVLASGAASDCAIGTAVTPGSTCTVRVIFNPTTSGPANGTLTITTNATNAPQGVFTAQLVALGSYPNTVASTITITTNPSPASVDLNQTIVFTATVTSSGGGTGIPSGTVTFQRSGTTTPLGTVPLSPFGQATFPYSSLPLGTSVITAIYNGDQTYQPAYSGSVTATVFTGPGDFTLGQAITCPNTVTVTAGQSAIYCLNVNSNNGFDQTITFSCSNLPANASCQFSPAALVPSVNGTNSYGLAIGTVVEGNQNGPHTERGRGPAGWLMDSMPLLAILVWLPGLFRRRRPRPRGLLLSLALSLCAFAALAGCGSGVVPGAATTPPGTYTVTINAAASTGSHTFNVTLIVQ